MPTEYKDTFEFRLFPEYEYTKAQSARFLLFQGRVEHWRAAINYANKFDYPNRISLLYMIGYHPKMREYVQKTNANVVVLCADISKQHLAVYDAYCELMDSLQKTGNADKEWNLLPQYISSREATYAYYGRDHTEDPMVKRYRDEESVMKAYADIVPTIKKAFGRYILIDKLHPEKTIDHKDLDKIIKRYFPYGREQCGFPKKSPLSPALARKAAAAGFAREDYHELLKIEDNDTNNETMRKNIKRCMMDINVKLRKCGYVLMNDILAGMQKPPYGWAADPCAAYCFSYAMRECAEDYWITDGCGTFPVKEAGESVVDALILGMKLARRRNFTLFSESGWRLSNRFGMMFDVEPIIPFSDMLIWVRKSIEEKTRIPVSTIDGHLWDVLCGRSDSLGVYDTGVIKEAISYFTWDKCREINQRYHTLDFDTKMMVKKKYKKSIPDQLIHSCTTQCSGWLWKPEMFYETLEKVYKSTNKM